MLNSNSFEVMMSNLKSKYLKFKHFFKNNIYIYIYLKINY